MTGAARHRRHRAGQAEPALVDQAPRVEGGARRDQQSGGAGAARAARDLEGDDDALADLQPANRVTELHHLGDALVPERKRAAQWKQAQGGGAQGGSPIHD